MERRRQRKTALVEGLSRQTSPTAASGMHIPCRLCYRAFTAYKSLYRHLRSVHDRTTISCPDCGDEFARKDILNRHRARKHRSDMIKAPELPAGRSKDSNDSLLSDESSNHSEMSIPTIPLSTQQALTQCEAKKPCGPCLSIQRLLSADWSLVNSRPTELSAEDPFLVALYMLTLLDPIVPSYGDDLNQRVRLDFQSPDSETVWLKLKLAAVALIRAQLHSRQAHQDVASPWYAAILLALMENSRENGDVDEAKRHVRGAHVFMKARHRETCGCGNAAFCEAWLSSKRPVICDTLKSKLSFAYGIPKIKTLLYRLCETTMRYGKGMPLLQILRVDSQRRWTGSRKEGFTRKMLFDQMETEFILHVSHMEEEYEAWLVRCS